MIALYLKNQDPFDRKEKTQNKQEGPRHLNSECESDRDQKLKSSAFLRALMFDKFMKCQLMLLEETWRSREMINIEKIKRLTRELQVEKQRAHHYKSSME